MFVLGLFATLLPVHAATFTVDAGATARFTGPGFGFPGFFEPGTSNPQTYPVSFPLTGALEVSLQTGDASAATFTVTAFRLGADTNGDNDAFQSTDAFLESAPYPTIEQISGFDLSQNLGEPGPAVLTLTAATHQFELRGAAGSYEGPGLYGGDSNPTALIAEGTFTGPADAPTALTFTGGFGWLSQAFSDPATTITWTGAAPPPPASAGLIPVQGLFTGAGGAPLTGSRAVTFHLWPDDDATTPAWSGAATVVFLDGAFSALLGSDGAEIPLSVFAANPALSLSVEVAGEGASDRVPVGWVPRAAWAQDAGSLGGEPASAYLTETQTGSLITQRLATATFGTPTAPGHPVPLGYLSTATAGLLPATGGLATGLRLAADPVASDEAARRGWVLNQLAGYVPNNGAAITGPISVTSAPTQANHVANKAYVDSLVSTASNTSTAWPGSCGTARQKWTRVGDMVTITVICASGSINVTNQGGTINVTHAAVGTPSWAIPTETLPGSFVGLNDSAPNSGGNVGTADGPLDRANRFSATPTAYGIGGFGSHGGQSWTVWAPGGFTAIYHVRM